MKKTIDSRTKTGQELLLAAFLASSALLVSATAASAQLVGVQLGSNPGYTGIGELGESFTPDAGPGSGSQVRTVNLGSGISFSISNPGSGNNYAESESNGNNPLAVNLFTSDNVIYNPGNSLTFTFSGLTNGASYNVALYAGDLGDRSGDDPVQFTVNGITETPVGAVYGNNSFILNTASSAGNFEIVSATASSLGAITIVGSDGTGGNGYAEVAGFGLAAASPAPEPSTWALMLAGLGAAVGFQVLRRRSA